MKTLQRLKVDLEGRLTLNGKRVNAVLVKGPVIVSHRPGEFMEQANYNFERSLRRDAPRRANAYLAGRRATISATGLFSASYISLTPVNFYRV